MLVTERILSALEPAIPQSEVLLVFRGGSSAYGVAGESSDEDIVVIAKGERPYSHVYVDGLDLFVFGEGGPDYGNPSTPLYAKSFWDCRLSLPGTLIWANPGEPQFYEALCKSEFTESEAKEMVGAAYRFLSFRFESEDENLGKYFYHAIRLSKQIETFGETGKWRIDVPEDTRQRMLEFKNDSLGWATEAWRPEIKEALEAMRAFAFGKEGE